MNHVDSLLTQLKAIKGDVEEWKKNLPSYYESITIPISDTDLSNLTASLDLYPYRERLDYLSGKQSDLCILMRGFIGHTMNMYRAVVLHIDRYVLGHMYRTASPSDEERVYCPFQRLGMTLDWREKS